MDADGGQLRVVHFSGYSGEHQLRWDGRDAQGRELVSGIYFARLNCTTGVSTHKLALLR